MVCSFASETLEKVRLHYEHQTVPELEHALDIGQRGLAVVQEIQDIDNEEQLLHDLQARIL